MNERRRGGGWRHILFGVVLAAGCTSPSPDDYPPYVADVPARPTAEPFRPLELPPGDARRTASGRPGPAYWQQRADYRLEATLDAERRTLAGKGVLTYTNASPDPLPYLWIALEQNLFAPESLGARAFPGDARYGNVAGDAGGLALKSVKVGGKAVPFRIYDTLAKVELPAPVAPGGGKAEIAFEWSFPIPSDGSDRFGREDVAGGTIFQVAQWFPAVAKYDDLRGWNTLPYLGPGEFYTDFGDYEVSITAPRAHLVAATGVLQNPEETLTATQRERLAAARGSRTPVLVVGPDEAGTAAARPAGTGPLTWKFRAENCRTFAFASSPAFLWDAASTGGVLCQSFYPREALPAWSRSTDHLLFSLEHYGAKWLPYPYPTATNVNGPVGGMEYPMIVFCSERKDDEELWLVTTHEIGHTWFPMVVNTDERRHAWMDEGFNTFLNWYATLARFPERSDRREWKGLLPGWFDGPKFLAHLTAPDRVPSDTPPDRMPSRMVGVTQYAKPAVGLVLLREEILGPERFDAAFRAYLDRWKFKSPGPAEFFRTMEDAAGADLAWFWRGWFLEDGYLDQRLVTGDAARARDDEEPVEPAEAADAAEPTTTVRVVQYGGLVMPAIVRAEYADGSALTRTIPIEAFAADRRPAVVFPAVRGETPVRVVLDPEARLPDVDRANNAARLR